LNGDDSASLRALARKCRQLARGVSLNEVAKSFDTMAGDWDRQAERAAGAEAKREAGKRGQADGRTPAPTRGRE
jgi:hypothetical protein